MFGDAWLSLLWVVLCAVLIIGLAYWFTKYVAGRNGRSAFGGLGTAGGTRRLKVLECLRVGKDQQLAVVQAGERFFLLGITASEISTLAELSPEEAQGWLAGQEGPEQLNFSQILQNIRKGKKQG